jgi:D-alanyl-D-alanine carboxypeptidase
METLGRKSVVPRLVIVALTLLLATTSAEAQTPRLLLNSSRAMLVDSTTGQTLFSKDADGAHAPASLVKMMTLYLALEEIERGRVRWDDAVLVSARAAETPRYRLGLVAGELVPLRVLLEAVGIASANDAASAVAEHLGNGDETMFVLRMNAKARELGLSSTTFVNPHGLPAPGQRTTARDMSDLIARLLRDHPDARAILGGQSFVYRGRPYGRSIPLFKDPGGVEALKTGFTGEAGYNLAVASWRGGQEFLIVVLGAKSRQLSYLDAARALRFGFVASGLEPAKREGPKPAVLVAKGTAKRPAARAAKIIKKPLRKPVVRP